MPKHKTSQLNLVGFEPTFVQFEDDYSPSGSVDNDGNWYAMDLSALDTQEGRIRAYFDFARERHAVYLRRAQGIPKPWTNDTFLRSQRFCNLYRELDTVSLWITENIIKPFEDHPDLWFMLCAARVINWPDTLQEMMDTPGAWPTKGKYDPVIADKVLTGRKQRGEKFITGAYIVNSVSSKHDPAWFRAGGKPTFIAHRTLGEIWVDRAKIRGEFKKTLQNSVETLQQYMGYGPFIAYQVTVDLSYSNKWLGRAPDYNTFNSAGPGTSRGLARVFNGGKAEKVKGGQEEKTRLLVELLEYSRDPGFWPQTHRDMKKGFAPLSISNLSNWCCETDKYLRLWLGEGKLRSGYEGVPKAPRTPSLF